MCHPKGRQPLGTFKVSEEKCDPNMECYCYRYNQGKVLLNSITVQTKIGCSDGCSNEGVVVSLRGERNFHYPKGFPCSTKLLDHASTFDFDGSKGGRARFDGRLDGAEDFEEEAMLGDCYQVRETLSPPPTACQTPLNAHVRGGSIEWKGIAGWQPESVCICYIVQRPCNWQPFHQGRFFPLMPFVFTLYMYAAIGWSRMMFQHVKGLLGLVHLFAVSRTINSGMPYYFCLSSC